MSAAEGACGAKAVARFLRPRSVAIIGISTRAGSAGQIILQCLKINRFAGEVHLVGRTGEPIDGRRVLKSTDELPEGVDLAVFTLPAAAVCEAIEACARRKVGTALVFAAGFSPLDSKGRIVGALLKDADGHSTAVRSDIVIGADGIHSFVRQTVAPKIEARFSGLCAFRCLVQADNAPEIALRPVQTLCAHATVAVFRCPTCFRPATRRASILQTFWIF